MACWLCKPSTGKACTGIVQGYFVGGETLGKSPPADGFELHGEGVAAVEVFLSHVAVVFNA